MMEELYNRHPLLKECKKDILSAKNTLINCFEAGGKLLICGNGGSCADGDHIAGELMKGFLKKRPISESQKDKMLERFPLLNREYLQQLQKALPAISLPSLTALNSAFCNDVNPELVYAQALMGLGNKDDILLCISTSGNSKNVCAAAAVGKSLGLTVIGLTGQHGGTLKDISSICICVPETETYKIQELHLPVYHYLCAEIEAHFFAQ